MTMAVGSGKEEGAMRGHAGWGDDEDRLEDTGLGLGGAGGRKLGKAHGGPRPAPSPRRPARTGRGCHALTWLVT